MPAYDANQFDPPAPVASVIFRHPATGASLSDVPMLIDTGADVTLLRRDVVEKLGVTPTAGKVYELQGFDGSVQFAEVVQLELLFLGKKIQGTIPGDRPTVGHPGAEYSQHGCALVGWPKRYMG